MHSCFAVFLLGLAQSYGSPVIAKVILSCVQDFEAILALSATETYGLMFILSYATSVLYKACFPEAVNLMRHCLSYNFFTPTFWEWKTSLICISIMTGNFELLLCCLANN